MLRIKHIFLLILLVLFELTYVYAPPGGSWNPGDTEPTVPIHGGILFLIISGLFYFFRKQLLSR